MSADPTAEHIDAVSEGMRLACSGPVIYRNDVARAILTSTDPAVHAALAASLPAEVMLAALVDRGNDQTETITDRAAIRDSDEPDERTPNEVHVDESGCSCKTGPYRGFQRDPIDAACPKHGEPLRHGDGDVTVYHPDGSTTIIREPSERGDFPYYDLGPATSETVDVPALVAEVRSLRAKVAAVEAVEDSWSGPRYLPSSAWPYVHHWLRDLRAALATGEGK